MFMSSITGQFAEELGELHDGSVSLFVILPVFRKMLVTERCAVTVARFEATIGEHLAHLDGILGDVLVRRDRADGHLTRSLFSSLAGFRDHAPSVERDAEIFGVIEQALLFLTGSCGFALRCARQASVDRSVQVLEESMRRIGSLALLFPAHPAASPHGRLHADAVA
jgi:hypothetical protein